MMQRADDERAARDDRLEFFERLERDALFAPMICWTWKNSANVRPRLSHIAKAMRSALGLGSSPDSASARLSSARFWRPSRGATSRHSNPETADAQSSGKAVATAASALKRDVFETVAQSRETTHGSSVPFDPWLGPAAMLGGGRRRQERGRATFCLAGRPAKHDSRRQSALVE